jgi:WS/DGAT/MGAT family acyltransferase
MRTLTLLDQVFWSVEQGGMAPMLIGGAVILDAAHSPWPLDGEVLAEHLAARMQKIPLMRQKLVRDPLSIGRLRLVDDPGFDARQHISRVRLKSPGGYRQFTECLAAYSGKPLDPDKPLWRCEVIEGLGGGRIAFAMRLHHALLDGVSALRELESLFDTRPMRPERLRRIARPKRAAPGALALLREGVLDNTERMALRVPRAVGRSAPPLMRALLRVLAARARQLAFAREASHGVEVPEVRRTSINVSHVSPRRSVSYVELPMPAVRALARRYGCSINDLTLLLVANRTVRFYSTIVVRFFADAR